MRREEIGDSDSDSSQGTSALFSISGLSFSLFCS